MKRSFLLMTTILCMGCGDSKFKSSSTPTSPDSLKYSQYGDSRNPSSQYQQANGGDATGMGEQYGNMNGPGGQNGNPDYYSDGQMGGKPGGGSNNDPDQPTKDVSLNFYAGCHTDSEEDAARTRFATDANISMSILKSSGEVVKSFEGQELQALINQVKTTKSSNVPVSLSLTDGKYYFVACDKAMQSECAPSQSLVRRVLSEVNDSEDAMRKGGSNGALLLSEFTKSGDNIQQSNSFSGSDLGYVLLDNDTDSNLCDESNSPLMIPIHKEKIEFSSPYKGNLFDVTGNGIQDLISWPKNASGSFIVLDKNDDGQINDISEMFGNNTVGPDGKKSANGFVALAKYDNNRDGHIDAKDKIFNKLQLFSDFNEDGVVNKGELSSLKDSKVISIGLAYSILGTKDKHGNEWREKSEVKFENGLKKPVFDIWFRTLPSQLYSRR